MTRAEQLQARPRTGLRRGAAHRTPEVFWAHILTVCIGSVLSSVDEVDGGEDGVLNQRRFSLAAGGFGACARDRIVEPELDMNRERHQPPILITRIFRIVRWLMPESRQVGSPMRSVARELEEIFPSRDN